jgi:hypothetical protein
MLNPLPISLVSRGLIMAPVKMKGIPILESGVIDGAVTLVAFPKDDSVEDLAIETLGIWVEYRFGSGCLLFRICD